MPRGDVTAQHVNRFERFFIAEHTDEAERPAPPSAPAMAYEVCALGKLHYGRTGELIGSSQGPTKRQHVDLVCRQQPWIDFLGRALAFQVEQERLIPEPLDRASVQLLQSRSLHQDAVREQGIESSHAEPLDVDTIHLSDRMAINPLQH